MECGEIIEVIYVVLCVSNNGNTHCFEYIQQIVIGKYFLCHHCMILGNQTCNHYMLVCCSIGFDISNCLNVADRNRADFWQVFDLGNIYDRGYIEEWWDRISDTNYHFDVGNFWIVTHDSS